MTEKKNQDKIRLFLNEALDMYDLIIFIAGPKMDHFYNEDLAFLNYFSKKIICIGDGKQNLLNIKNNLLIDELNKLSNKISEKKILVYVSAHGAELDTNHFILTDECQFGRKATKKNIFVYTKYLFELLNNIINKPFDVIFFPCASRYAVSHVSCLPEGSRVVIIDGYSTPHAARNAIFKKNINPRFFNLDFYYDHVLANLGYYTSPLLVESGGTIIDPVALSSNYLGKLISMKSKSYINKNFGMNVYKDNQQGLNRLNNLIIKIQSAKSLNEFVEHDVDLVKRFFYACIWIELNCPYVLNKEKMKDEIIKFKSKLDTYLNKQNLPFELDLNSNLWFIKMTQDRSQLSKNSFQDFEERMGKIAALYSPRGCIDSVYDYGLKIKSNFIIPDYPDYGLVLGVIKNLAQLDNLTSR